MISASPAMDTTRQRGTELARRAASRFFWPGTRGAGRHDLCFCFSRGARPPRRRAMATATRNPPPSNVKDGLPALILDHPVKPHETQPFGTVVPRPLGLDA